MQLFFLQLGEAHEWFHQKTFICRVWFFFRFLLFSEMFGCERQLGMDRGDLKDIDGFFAVLLWDEYQQTGDQKAHDTLLAYNIQDTVTLENLIVTAYNMKLKETHFYETHLIEEPTLPVNPYSADLATVDRIKNSLQYWLSDQWY